MPEILVEKDYDGYFENLVREWCSRKQTKGNEFKNNKIIITAGPYRMDAVTTRHPAPGVIHIDFYAALRTGFGHLSEQEVEQIIDLL